MDSVFLAQASSLLSAYKYPLVFVGVIIEGPLLMIACGFFLRLGVFSFWPLYLSLVAGDLVADIAWYYIGHFFARPLLYRYGKFFGLTQEKFDKAVVLFRKYHTKILLISKLTIGLGMALATLVVAGASRVPIKAYILLNAIGEILLVAVLLSVGYFFGNVYSNIAGGFKIFFAIGAALIAVVSLYGFSRYMKNKILEQ